MKRILSLIAAAAALGFLQAPAIAAEPGLYGSFSAGYLVPLDRDGDVGSTDATLEFDAGAAFNGALGYRFDSGFRTEFEVGYGWTKADKIDLPGGSVKLDGADISIWTATANAFYDFDIGTRFSPYVGGGVGLAHTRVDDFSGAGVDVDGEHDTDLMALAEVGLGFEVNDRITVAPAYRFLWINNGEDGDDDDRAHLFRIGVRVGF